MTKSKKSSTTWKPGQSGNPNGRKPGTGETTKIRAAIADRVPEILEALAIRALDGDIGAARLLLERTIAPLKAVEPTQVLNLSGGTLTDQGRAVLSAVAAGELAPGQGAVLVSAIGGLARLVEIDELAARVAALEKANGTH